MIVVGPPLVSAVTATCTELADTIGVQSWVNASQTFCPTPIIRLAEQIRASDHNCIGLVATDPGTIKDLPAWCKPWGHELERSVQEQNEGVVYHIFVVRPQRLTRAAT